MSQKLVIAICMPVCILNTVAVFSQNSNESSQRNQQIRIEDRTFVALSDMTEQKYVLVYPPGFDDAEPVSLLITLHGHGADRWQFVKQTRGECRGARDVASRHGMLLVSPDYRAKTSWMGPQAEADMVQIINTLKQRFDVKHVIVSGASMGGTGALTFTARNADLVDGVVSLNGTADLMNYERFSDAIARSFGGSREVVPDEYHDRSAEFFPSRFTMPIATATGGADEVVPPDSVLRLLDSVRKKNRNVLSIHRPGGGHSTNYDDTVQAFEYVIDRVNSVRSASVSSP